MPSLVKRSLEVGTSFQAQDPTVPTGSSPALTHSAAPGVKQPPSKAPQAEQDDYTMSFLIRAAGTGDKDHQLGASRGCIFRHLSSS